LHVEGKAMNKPMIGLGVGSGLAAMIAGALFTLVVGACGRLSNSGDDGDSGETPFQPDGNHAATAPGTQNPEGGDGTIIVTPGRPGTDAGPGATTRGPRRPTAHGSITAADCPGCIFPSPGAPACANGPPINIVYPADTVILPPNLNVISIQW